MKTLLSVCFVALIVAVTLTVASLAFGTVSLGEAFALLVVCAVAAYVLWDAEMDRQAQT